HILTLFPYTTLFRSPTMQRLSTGSAIRRKTLPLQTSVSDLNHLRASKPLRAIWASEPISPPEGVALLILQIVGSTKITPGSHSEDRKSTRLNSSHT